MILPGVEVNSLNNEELAKAILRAQKLTDGGYELYDRNEAAILKTLRKILRLSKQEQEWYVYFVALYEILYETDRCGDYKSIIKYAEVYYKDSALYMDSILPVYADTDLSFYNTWTYGEIFEAYSCYYQIDDAKMNVFMKRYEEAAHKYGKTFSCYEDEMALGILYRDIDMLRHGKKYFEKYEYQLKSCYVCAHKQYLGYYLIQDQVDLAEEFLLTILQKKIPKIHQWCYSRCQNAEAGAMYMQTLEYCLTLGKTEYFDYFYKRYWLEQPKEVRETEPAGWERTLTSYCLAITGDFERMDKDLQAAGEDVREGPKNNTVENMRNWLMWWCYFRRLDQSGIHEVEIELTDVSLNENGKVSCQALSGYFEQKADDDGTKFERARVKFDYSLVKNAYLECAGGMIS